MAICVLTGDLRHKQTQEGLIKNCATTRGAPIQSETREARPRTGHPTHQGLKYRPAELRNASECACSAEASSERGDRQQLLPSLRLCCTLSRVLNGVTATAAAAVLFAVEVRGDPVMPVDCPERRSQQVEMLQYDFDARSAKVCIAFAKGQRTAAVCDTSPPGIRLRRIT